MDQNAFREIMATPRPGGNKAKVLGGGKKVKIVEEFVKPEFKPRKKFVKKEDSKYQDRASMRREGKDNEFTAIEQLKSDFELRTLGLNPELIASQNQYLGGDAEHSVIVKGLDFSLLEMIKSRQGIAEEEDFDIIEKRLDLALTKSKEGKSREEIREEMKLRLAGGITGTSGDGTGAEITKEDGFNKAKSEGKFKSITKTSKKSKVPTASTSTNPSEAQPEKKRRKKKLIPTATTATAEPIPSTSKLPAYNPNILSHDSDDDIFGGVAEYKVDSDSDDDSNSTTKVKVAPPPISSAATRNLVKRSYFDDEEEETISISTAPSAVSNLSSTKSVKSKQEASPEPEFDPTRPLGRLVGFSNSSLSAKDLLEMDSAAMKEEERKAKKAKYGKVEGEEKKEKILTEEDKLNRDYLALNKYIEKKNSGKGEEEEEE